MSSITHSINDLGSVKQKSGQDEREGAGAAQHDVGRLERLSDSSELDRAPSNSTKNHVAVFSVVDHPAALQVTSEREEEEWKAQFRNDFSSLSSFWLSPRSNNANLGPGIPKCHQGLQGAAFAAVELGAIDDAQDMGCSVFHDARAAQMLR